MAINTKVIIDDKYTYWTDVEVSVGDKVVLPPGWGYDEWEGTVTEIGSRWPGKCKAIVRLAERDEDDWLKENRGWIHEARLTPQQAAAWARYTLRDTIPCEVCGTPTGAGGCRRCGNCWEVEARLGEYLKNPKGIAFVRILLKKYAETPQE